MDNNLQTRIEDALNSMLRTDYIPLRDTAKLMRLSRYYVDYFGYLRQIVGESDQLIVGRRGTGKTTLLYRALIECINSWREDADSIAKKRTLAVYLDLSKCHTLTDTTSNDFSDFEHVFVCEIVDTIREELVRSWPAIAQEPGLVERMLSPSETKKRKGSNDALNKLVNIISNGIPRTEEEIGLRKVKQKEVQTTKDEWGILGKVSAVGASGQGCVGSSQSDSSEKETEVTKKITSRLSIADVLRGLNDFREACSISHIVVLVDEFSALSPDLQRRFSSLLRKILGNHAGVYIKLCAITDNFSLGSSIILQRDLFELSLDLDAFVERSGTLNAAMEGLSDLTRELVTARIREYTELEPDTLIEFPSEAWIDLSRSAMGVPRTIGIALKQAFYRCIQSNRPKIRKSDIEYGIKYAAKAYQGQFLGACGVAIPSYSESIWNALLDRAIEERSKVDAPCSHFMILPKNEERLRYLNMFFLVHLVTKGRTTKKEKLSRSLYSFDYGVCIENNLGYGTEKNTIRQQRFAYDGALKDFDPYFERSVEKKFQCKKCSAVYKESDLYVAGKLLTFCPNDRFDLEEVPQNESVNQSYTEEEMKIIGAIRSSHEEDRLLARQVADDVGCYVQKVAKFGARLEREEIIRRRVEQDIGKNIYFGKERAQEN